MAPEKRLLSYEYKHASNNGEANYIYSMALQDMLGKISDKNTVECILEHSIDAIIPEDKKLVERRYGDGKTYSDIVQLAVHIRQLRTIYEISKAIEYKSVILGWNRDKARFFIKEKIKNDAPELSFLEFVEQLPFLMAIC